jgi:hypothetical protein
VWVPTGAIRDGARIVIESGEHHHIPVRGQVLRHFGVAIEGAAQTVTVHDLFRQESDTCQPLPLLSLSLFSHTTGNLSCSLLRLTPSTALSRASGIVLNTTDGTDTNAA